MTYWAKVTVVVLLTYTVLQAAAVVSSILLLVLIAFVLAVGLDPAVRYCSGCAMRRGTAVATIFLTFAVHRPVRLPAGPAAREADLGSRRTHPPVRAEPGQPRRRDRAVLPRARRHADVQNFVENMPTKIRSRSARSLGWRDAWAARFQLVTVAILTIYFMLSLPTHAADRGARVPGRGANGASAWWIEPSRRSAATSTAT